MDEVVTTLLLNFIVLLLVSLLLEGPLKDPMGLGWPQAEPVTDAAELPRFFRGLRLHAGLLLALLFSFIMWIVSIRTTLGYEMRAVGFNQKAARFAGMPVKRVMIITALISGGIAGIAGFSEVAGMKGNLTLDLSPGFGYTGIVVAMLAQLHPLGVIISASFCGQYICRSRCHEQICGSAELYCGRDGFGFSTVYVGFGFVGTF